MERKIPKATVAIFSQEDADVLEELNQIPLVRLTLMDRDQDFVDPSNLDS